MVNHFLRCPCIFLRRVDNIRPLRCHIRSTRKICCVFAGQSKDFTYIHSVCVTLCLIEPVRQRIPRKCLYTSPAEPSCALPEEATSVPLPADVKKTMNASSVISSTKSLNSFARFSAPAYSAGLVPSIEDRMAIISVLWPFSRAGADFRARLRRPAAGPSHRVVSSG